MPIEAGWRRSAYLVDNVDQRAAASRTDAEQQHLYQRLPLRREVCMRTVAGEKKRAGSTQAVTVVVSSTNDEKDLLKWMKKPRTSKAGKQEGRRGQGRKRLCKHAMSGRLKSLGSAGLTWKRSD